MEVKNQIDKSQLSSNDTSLFNSHISKNKKPKSSRMRSLLSMSTQLKQSSNQKILSSISRKLIINNIEVISKKKEYQKPNLFNPIASFNFSCIHDFQVNKNQLMVGNHKNLLEYSHFKSNKSTRENLIEYIHVTRRGDKVGCFQQNCQIKRKWLKKILFLQKQYKNTLLLKQKKSLIKPDLLCQIEKDVIRSFDTKISLKSKINVLQSMQQHTNLIQILKQVLVLYSIYDKQLQYVQGMNLVAAQIVLHIKEINSSYIYFKQVMNYGKLRQFYLSNFTYLKDEVNFVLKKQLKYYNIQLYKFLDRHQINFTIFVAYYLVLFCSFVDVKYTHIIINQFMKHGIKFLHKFLLVLLLNLKEMIMDEDDSPVIKLSSSFIKTLGIDWSLIIEFSQKIDLI